MNIIIRKEQHINVGGKMVRVASKSDEKALGVARYEEIKERVKDAQRDIRKPYALSKSAHKEIGHIKTSGVGDRFLDSRKPKNMSFDKYKQMLRGEYGTSQR